MNLIQTANATNCAVKPNLSNLSLLFRVFGLRSKSNEALTRSSFTQLAFTQLAFTQSLAFFAAVACLPMLTASGCSASQPTVAGSNPQQENATADSKPATKTGSKDQPVAKASSTESDQDDETNAEPTSKDWWYFRGNKKATGWLKKSQLTEELDVVWEFESDRSAFESSPVSNGKQVIVGDLDGRFWCLDFATGKKNWSLETESCFIASPSLQDDRIYVGDTDGIFHCYQVADGKELWKFQSDAQIDSAANFYGDNVLFGSQDSVLYCLDAKSGTEQWTHGTDDQIRCSIVVAGDLTYVAGCDGRLHIVNLKTGEAAGEVGLTSVTGSTPANSGDRVYFGLEDGMFLCADVAKKEIVWEWTDAQREAAIRGSAAITDQVAIFGTRGRQVVCLKLEDGSEVWKKEVDRKVDGSPVIVGDRVYVGDGAGKLLVLELKTGETIQELELSGSILGSPCVVGNRLIVATDEGMVYCLGKK